MFLWDSQLSECFWIQLKAVEISKILKPEFNQLVLKNKTQLHPRYKSKQHFKLNNSYK